MNSILVTGGTGSFGQAFISRFLTNPCVDRICVFSRGEHAQAAMREALGDPAKVRWFIGDVRDKERLIRACRGVDTIIHAAALKRIEVGAYNPDEMVKTNVLGAMNVIDAALANRARRVVYLSTDKAYQPISPYGQSKALAESLFLTANDTQGRHSTSFAVTRYGNIWGAKGSVVPRWRGILAPNPRALLPVTDPDATRFFMRMEEAVDLVEHTLDSMPDQVVIPDWLPAYRVADLVDAFEADWTPQGLPPWEKLHESMCDGVCSADARRMTVSELREELGRV